MSGSFWKKFQSLLPDTPLEIGTVNAVYGNGVYLVDKLGGGQVRVNGSTGYAKGARIFLKDGAITATAPDLEQVEIEV